MSKKRPVNPYESDGEEMTLSQEAIANGKKLVSQVRKVLESETEKEKLDLLEYDIFAIVYAMMDMPKIATNWAKACDEYAVAAYQLAHELASGLQEIDGKKTHGIKTNAESTFELIEPKLVNTLIDPREMGVKPVTLNVPIPVEIFKTQMEPTTKLYLYHEVGNGKVELIGNKEEFWNNHLDTLDRIYDSEFDDDDDEDNLSQTSQSQLYSSDDEPEANQINPKFSNELEDGIDIEERDDNNPTQLLEFDDCHHDIADEADLIQEEMQKTQMEETGKKTRNKSSKVFEFDSKATLSQPWATLDCHNIESNHVEAKRRKLTKQTKTQNRRKKGSNIGLRAAENVINEIAKGTSKRPGKITKIKPNEDVVVETCNENDDDQNEINHDDDCDFIQFNGMKEIPESSFIDKEINDSFEEMLNKKTEENLKNLLKGKEDTLEASQSMHKQIVAWHSKMSQMLGSSLGELNVRKYETEILQRFDTKPSETLKDTQSQVEGSVNEVALPNTIVTKKATFQEISAGKSKFEVSRLFVTTLMMINSGNVDITSVESHFNKETTCPVAKNFELSLRSDVLQHTEIDEVIKKTIQGNKRTSKTPSKKTMLPSQSTSNSSQHQPGHRGRKQKRDDSPGPSKSTGSCRKIRKISSGSSDSDWNDFGPSAT